MRSGNYKRRQERASARADPIVSELQTSGFAALLAAVDSQCRQSQDSQPPQPPLTAAGTMVLVLRLLAKLFGKLLQHSGAGSGKPFSFEDCISAGAALFHTG